MTKQRKVYAAFLALAAVGFVGDRLFLQPAGAGAAPPEEEASENVVAQKPAEKRKAGPSGPSLATKLQGVSPSSGKSNRDPFRRGDSTATSGTDASIANAAPLVDPVTPSEFSSRYELQSVLKPSQGSSGRAVAVVAKKKTSGTRESGRAYELGNEVAGWTLVIVDEKSATLERDSARVTLDLKATAKVDNRDATKRLPSN
jgi:hypothetical protein